MQITVEGIICHYEQEGEGQDVLLLHGWGCDTSIFRMLFDVLKAKCRVTVLDFAGHGKSGAPPPDGWDVSDYARWTAGVMKGLGIAPCDVLAHSFGGRVAILLAATQPTLLRRLVLTGAHGIVQEKTAAQSKRAKRYQRLKKVANVLPGGKKLRALLADHFGSEDYRALNENMRRTFVKVIHQDLRAYLPLIKAPTLLVWGREDDATPLWFGELMKQAIPDAGLIVYEGCGHYAFLEKAGEFNHVVQHFFLTQQEEAE